jgi:hypothetical protein
LSIEWGNVYEAFVAERAGLLEEGNRLLEQAEDLRELHRERSELRRRAKQLPKRERAELDWSFGERGKLFGKSEWAIWDRVNELQGRYRELLPDVTVARCPFTDEVVRWGIDTVGLDGWFWKYRVVVRRWPNPVPRTWIGMTGAMRLAEPVEYTQDLVMPGPGVPFVVPRILSKHDVRAVIAEVPVGAHTGWAITYFERLPTRAALMNQWGSGTPQNFRTAHDEKVSEYDFALTEWLRSGLLLWIEPGDESATLREGVDGCPFIDLPGPRTFANICRGEIWYETTAFG